MTDEEFFEDMRRRAMDYRAAFAHPLMQNVLMDLARFCRAGKSAAPELEDQPHDHDRMMLILGRQQVWLRIERFLNLQPDQLYKLFTGKQYQPKE